MHSDTTRTTTSDALLGMLTLRPMSGYEMRQSISGSIGNFWSESFGQIYPTLKRLKEDGLIASEEGGRAGSKVFSLTHAGWQRVREWLTVPPRPSVPRSELLLKVFFGNLAAPETVERHIAGEREHALSDLARYDAIERRIVRDHKHHPGLPYWLMTVKFGQSESRAIVAWCDETLVQLQQRQAQEVAP